MPKIQEKYRVRLAIVVLALGVVFVGVPPVVTTASAQPLGGACQHVGRVRPKPGLTTDAKAFTFSFKGNVGPCQLSDGSTRWGVESGAGRANGDCVSRTASAKWTIVWNTGTRTVIDAAFAAAGNVISTSGNITKGEFVGGVWRDGHFLSGFLPTACTSSRGVTEATYQGAFVIGST
jgi:hypothetical protein